MGCSYGLFPWGVVLTPRGAPTGGALQCQAAIPFPPFPPLSLLSLPPLLPTPSMLLPSFFLSEPLTLWGSPQVGGVFFIGGGVAPRQFFPS